MGKIESIEKCIKDAENGISKLPKEILDYPGFTNKTVKMILNNLGTISTKYLEIGIHKCSTFISTLYKNELTGIGVDNWVQFDQAGMTKKMAYESCEEFIKENQYELIEQDYYKLEDIKFSDVDLYLFDGEHSYESQKWGITNFVPKLKKGCLVIIDDASWPQVRQGTYNGIKELGLQIEYENFLWDGRQEGIYWNGLFLFIFK